MLDELRREDPAQRPLVEALQIRERIAFLNVEALAAAEGGHVRVEVDAPGLDARLGEQRQELAAPTADVEHRSRVAEVVDVRALAIADQLPRAAHAALEGEVVEGLRRRLADRTRRPRAAGSPELRASARRV